MGSTDKKISYIKLTKVDNFLMSDYNCIDGYALNENDRKESVLLYFVCKYCDYLNYSLEHTFTAYGNPEYDNLSGWISGFCFAMGAEVNTQSDVDTIMIGKYTFIFDKPFEI